jgi:hypothetical protein
MTLGIIMEATMVTRLAMMMDIVGAISMAILKATTMHMMNRTAIETMMTTIGTSAVTVIVMVDIMAAIAVIGMVVGMGIGMAIVIAMVTGIDKGTTDIGAIIRYMPVRHGRLNCR